MRLFVISVGLLTAVLLPAERSAAADSARCAVPREIIEDEPRLARLAADFKGNRAVTIVVIGGASTAGLGPEISYPFFLEAALRRHHPKQPITVINRGVGGQTAEQMAARFAKDVFSAAPSLVVWETGTVDAVRGEDANAFADALTNGIAALRQHNSGVMLMDMQYSPGAVSVINFEPYLEALYQAAALESVYLFQRFNVMKYWDESGAFAFNVPREKRAAVAREVYECLGERLADAIDYAAR
jgi:lysophospholipase L1-like esterase